MVLLGFWIAGLVFVGWLRLRSGRWAVAHLRKDLVAGLVTGSFAWAVFRIALL